ncbi:MAG: glycosyltransferase family 2 protein [Candidatus Hermodarchaeia archaeon]|jgi:glycosyltransferase involved in cell wall biosynthesis
MDVSVVIRTKNEAKFIAETLKRVREQDFGGKYEIIIVDSGSTDPTLQIVKKHRVKLLQISEKEFSYGASLNLGAIEARGDFVVNLSAHALPEDNKWLTNLVTGFEDAEVAGVYGRQVSNGHLNPFEARRNKEFFGDERLIFTSDGNTPLQKLHFSNANSAIRKQIWQRFNFNERVQYAEDILWQNEVIQGGFSIVYAPDSVVYHTHKPDIQRVYKNSRDCAYEVASMKQKTKSNILLVWDLSAFFVLVITSMFSNMKYVYKNRHIGSLKITPWYVVAEGLGWLVGRMKYRSRKGL